MCAGKKMDYIKKIVKIGFYGLGFYGMAKLLGVLIVLVGATIYPNSSDKMKLPWNKYAAIKVANEYYATHYKQEIRYKNIEVLGISDGDNVRDNCYAVYFERKKKPKCEFYVKVDYDLDTEELCVSRDTYLLAVMNEKMREEVRKDIEDIYGKKYELLFSYDFNRITDEAMTIDKLKNTTDICILLYLNDQKLTKSNQEIEAKKLWTLHNKMSQKGYQIKEVSYYWGNMGIANTYALSVPKPTVLKMLNT